MVPVSASPVSYVDFGTIAAGARIVARRRAERGGGKIRRILVQCRSVGTSCSSDWEMIRSTGAGDFNAFRIGRFKAERGMV